MNYFELENKIEETIEEWKKITVFAFRIHPSWWAMEYFQFLDLLIYLERDTNPESVFSWPAYHFTHYNPMTKFYKKLLTSLKQNGYENAEKNKLVFADEDEEIFYSYLPNSFELLLDGLIFMFLPKDKHKRIMLHLVSKLLLSYHDQVRLNYSQTERSLIKTFRKLSVYSKNDVKNYVSYLLDKESR